MSQTMKMRYRFGLCAIVSIWGQLPGNGLITYFLLVLLLQAGIIDPNRQRVLNFVNSITSFVGALSGTAIVDKVGRRKLFLTAEICCNAMRASAGISFIFLFMVLFGFGITPPTVGGATACALIAANIPLSQLLGGSTYDLDDEPSPTTTDMFKPNHPSFRSLPKSAVRPTHTTDLSAPARGERCPRRSPQCTR
ncbi:hypothetical protein EHS25_005917 [Saitozyma podzolica]|uniref:Major facilitator superfamily (MFS) profile domain-containing protein n=1 Tax=Saitozyma podzolica TaxID=1890683 RepID=A0A427XVU2_9TREE|nr:hypothetical protein EHS25_005917 [Saitozyma podzolica]